MGLGQFFSILEYVCSKTDVYFAKVDKNYTSQICSNCGTHTGSKDLSVRVHNCTECGYTQDRDVAAAEVVRNRGLESIAVGAPQRVAQIVVLRRLGRIRVRIKQPSNGGLAGASA